MMPTLLLFCLMLAVLAPASAQDSDPFNGDSRLLKKHTIKAVGIPLKELLEELTKETGIQLAAGPKVAEDKLVLFAHDRPLADSLRVIAKFFNFYWGRTGQPGGYAYTLSQSLKQSQAEQAEIDAQISRIIDSLLEDAQGFEALDRLSPEELKALEESLSTRLREKNDDAAYSDLMTRQSLAHRLIFSPYSTGLYRLLKSLGRDGIGELLRGGRLEFTFPAEPGARPMDRSLAQKIFDSFSHRVEGHQGFDRVRMMLAGTARELPYIQVTMRLSSSSGGSTIGTGIGNPRAAIVGYRPPVEPVGWQKVAFLNDPLTLAVPWRPDLKDRDDYGLPPTFLARILKKLSDVRPFDLISDAFYVEGGQSIQWNGRPLGEALSHISRVSGHRWRLEQGFVQLKAYNYASSRAYEPSIFDLRRWASLSDEELYSLDRLAEIAAQSPRTASISFQVLADSGRMGHAHNLLQARSQLVLWNSLLATQKASALSQLGTAYSALSPKSRRLFEDAVAEAPGMAGRSTSDSGPSVGRLQIHAAKLSVSTLESKMWGFRGESVGSATTAPSRDAAIESLRRSNPSLKDSDVWDVRNRTYQFRYLTADGASITADIRLPSIWRKPQNPADTP